MSFSTEGIREAGIPAVERLRQLIHETHGVILPEVATEPAGEWAGDPSQLVVFDDDKYPVKGGV